MIDYEGYKKEFMEKVEELKKVIDVSNARIDIIDPVRLYKCGEIYEYFVHMSVGAQVMNVSLCGMMVLINKINSGVSSSTKLWKVLRPYCARNTEKRKKSMINALLYLKGEMTVERFLSDSDIDKYRRMRELDLTRICIDKLPDAMLNTVVINKECFIKGGE